MGIPGDTEEGSSELQSALVQATPSPAVALCAEAVNSL